MPRCNTCNVDKHKSEFSLISRASGLRKVSCKTCATEAEKRRRDTPRGRAAATWNSIQKRVKNQAEYRGVEVRMTRETFLDWATPRFAAWFAENPHLRPSVDREDPAGHYEIGNIRLLELGENSRRCRRNHNVHAPNGQAWCGKCRRYKSREEFGKNKSRHGLAGVCKECRKVKEHKTNPNWKNQKAPEGCLWCGRCQTYKNRDDFYACRHGPTGKQTTCKTCQSQRSREKHLNRTA